MVVRDTLIYGLSRVIPGLAGFFAVALFVRHAGEASYGAYALAFSIVAMSADLAVGWLAQGQLRYLSRVGGLPKAALPLLLRGARRGLLVGALFTLGALAWNGLWACIPVALIALVAMAWHNLRLAGFQASVAPARVLVAESLRAGSGIALALAALQWGGTHYAWLLAGIGAGYAIALLVPSPWSVESGEPTVAPTAPLPTLAEFWQFGWPMSLWLLGSAVLPVIERSALLRHWGETEAGRYTSVFELVVRGFGFALFPITLAVHGRIMARVNQITTDPFADRQAATTYAIRATLPLILKSMGAMLILWAFGFVLIYYFGNLSLRYVLGEMYRPHPNMLYTLALSGLFWQIAQLAHKPLEIALATRHMLAAMAIAVVANLVLVSTLVKPLGTWGVALANAGAGLTYIIVVVFFVLRLISKEPR